MSGNIIIIVYANISSNLMITKNYMDLNEECTFYGNECLNINNLNEGILKANKLYNEYNNKIVNCDYNENIDNIYLYKSFDYYGMIVLCIFNIIFQLMQIYQLRVFIIDINI